MGRRVSSNARDAGLGDHGTLLGGSAAMLRVREAIGRLAPLRSPVLVRGESGTGKELAAAQLHRQSGRRGAFVAVNCGAIGPGLAESRLFGHVRGAFTGAVRDRDGAFVRADGGTLFLDEVAELPLPLQAMLLRVLETGQVLPIGAETERRVDARLVAATHRDLEGLVAQGCFREDLYHRLRVLEVVMPPLRERPEDIPPLLSFFAMRAGEELGRTVELDEEAVAAARHHRWPGNVRALRNAVLRAGAGSRGPVTSDVLLDAGTANGGDTIVIPRGDYRSMHRALLRAAVAQAGSIRKAALALAVPKSTLHAWLKR
jgi:two-component system NtrC family response regulator